MPTLIRNHAEVAGIYHQSRDNHVGLVDQVREHAHQEAERIERARKAIDRKK